MSGRLLGRETGNVVRFRVRQGSGTSKHLPSAACPKWVTLSGVDELESVGRRL